MEAFGIKIMFFTNLQIREEMNGVLSSILSNLPQTPSFIRKGRQENSSGNE
jgi:hypothetical protein